MAIDSLSDSKYMLIYKKDTKISKSLKLYELISPRLRITYPKNYESSKFYLYDLGKKICFIGIFPSDKVPPFPVLHELK
jgi:hypothetical protein